MKKTVRKTTTSTTTVTATVTTQAPVAKRDAVQIPSEPEIKLNAIDQDDFIVERGMDEPEVDSSEVSDVPAERHELAARNLCAACPAGKPVIPAGKNNERLNAVYCCPGGLFLAVSKLVGSF